MTIASILKLFLGFDSKILKLDHDRKNNQCGSISVRLITLKQSASFQKLAKIGQKSGIQNKSTATVEIKVISVP